MDDQDSELTWQPNVHCLALDGIRGLAILSVTLYRLIKEIAPDLHPALDLARRIAPVGERGVDLFFVLSGFLITGILLRSKNKKHYFRNFMMRRALRIFPLYFLSLAVGLGIIATFFSSQSFEIARGQQLYLWTYTSNLRMSWLNEWCMGPFDHFWSLAVEEHFYLLWPVVVWLLSRRQLTVVCIAMFVVVGVARTIAASQPQYAVAVDVATYFRADALGLGALLAIIMTSSVPRAVIHNFARSSVFLLLPLAIAIAVHGGRWLELPSSLCPLLFMAGMAVILLSHPRGLLVGILQSSPLRALGKYSYGMYVVQLPLVTLLPLSSSGPWLAANPIWASSLYVLTMFLLIFLSAVASFHLIESHFLRLKSRF